jgi:hypothetical protein
VALGGATIAERSEKLGLRLGLRVRENGLHRADSHPHTQRATNAAATALVRGRGKKPHGHRPRTVAPERWVATRNPVLLTPEVVIAQVCRVQPLVHLGSWQGLPARLCENITVYHPRQESPSCPKTAFGLARYKELKQRQFLWCFVVNSVKSFGLICDFFYKKVLIICGHQSSHHESFTYVKSSCSQTSVM